VNFHKLTKYYLDLLSGWRQIRQAGAPGAPAGQPGAPGASGGLFGSGNRGGSSSGGVVSQFTSQTAALPLAGLYFAAMLF
jgi:hypothetical protein